jgi:hypothetical protein
MPHSEALSIVDRIARIDVLWDAAHWRNGPRGLELRSEPTRAEDRFEYSDSAGAAWTAYLDGARVEVVEICFDLRDDIDEDTPTETIEALFDEYSARFDRHRAALDSRLGPGELIEESEMDGHPVGECAHLAGWRFGKNQVFLALKFEGRDAPMRLCLILAPG